MACGILLVTHPGIGASLLAVATALLRQLPLKAEAFEVPLDADLEALLPQASAALRRVDGGDGVAFVAQGQDQGAVANRLEGGQLARGRGAIDAGSGVIEGQGRETGEESLLLQ